MSDQPKFFYGYAVAAAGFVIWMVVFGIHNTFGIFYLPLITEFGWQRADTVFALSLGTFTMSVFGLFTGWLSDRLDARIVVTVFGAFMGLAFLLLGRMDSLWQFQLLIGVVAPLGMSVSTTPVMATLARWFVRKRGFVTGWVQSGLGLGGLVFAPLTGWMIVQFGWRNAYTVLGVIALFGLVLPGFFMWREPGVKGQQPDGAAAPPPNARPSFTEETESFLPNAGMSMVCTKEFWIVAGIYAIFGFCRSTFTAHTAAHVQDMGFSLMAASRVMAVLMGASIVGRIGMGWLADHVGNRRTFMLSYAATTGSMLLALATAKLWGLYLYAFIFGFGWGAQAVLRFGLTAEAFGLKNLGLVIGILGIGEALAAALGAYYAGFFFDLSGSYRPAFWTGAVLSVSGIALSVCLKPKRQ